VTITRWSSERVCQRKDAIDAYPEPRVTAVSNTADVLADAAAILWRRLSALTPDEVEEMAPEYLGPVMAAAGPFARLLDIPIGRNFPELVPVVHAVLNDEEIGPIFGTERGPMLVSPRGASRVRGDWIVASLFTSARLEMFYRGVKEDSEAFVGLVVEGFGALRQAVRGEEIECHDLIGFRGLAIPENREVETPWGVLRRVPDVSLRQLGADGWAPMRAGAVLVVPRRAKVGFSVGFNPAAVDLSSLVVANTERARRLLPLACALVIQGDTPVAPVPTWTTILLPFGTNARYSGPFSPELFGPHVDLGTGVSELEEWARVVDESHRPEVDIAAGRAVSAVSTRLDPIDVLIDAVMVWENLFGTSSETTFRITAAMTKLLEPDPAKRRAYRKELGEIYDVRSKVVHGVPRDTAVVRAAAKRATELALAALRASYRRGAEWLCLSSVERADLLILDEV
jgi:hypothetical protein